MPLYSDSNFYYTAGGASGSPYYTSGLYGVSSPSTSSSAYAPYSSTYNRAMTGSYVVPLSAPRSPTYTALSSRYQPKLSTITESPLVYGSSRHTSLMPLTRIQSPKYSTYTAPTTTTTPRYIAARPININTADIDVSSSRYRSHKQQPEEPKEQKEEQKEEQKPPATTSTPSPKSSTNAARQSDASKEESNGEERQTARSTIKRNRAVVRLSTVRSRSKDRSSKASPEFRPAEHNDKRFRDLPRAPETENMTWRQKLAQDLAEMPTYPLKKTPGDLLRERYLIQEAKKEEENISRSARLAARLAAAEQAVEVAEPPKVDKVLVELDPVDHTIRRLSIPNCPTFHDICEDISSDKIDDDLNAGALRRRASLIQEQEQELLNELQRTASETFQNLPLERQSSRDNMTDDSSGQPATKHSKKKSKKLRHKITAIVEVENAPLIPIIQEHDEEAVTPSNKDEVPKPKFTFNVESVEEHQEIQKIFKLPKKKEARKSIKSKKQLDDAALPEGFLQAIPKAKRTSPKSEIDTAKTYISTAEIFTFSQTSVDEHKAEEIEPLVALKDDIIETFTIKSPKKPAQTAPMTKPEKPKTDLIKQQKIMSEPDKAKQLKKENLIKPQPKTGILSTTEKTVPPLESKATLKTATSLDLNATKVAPKTPISKSKSLNIEESKPASPTTPTTTKPTLSKVKAIQESVELVIEDDTQEVAPLKAMKKPITLKSAISLDIPSTTPTKAPAKVLEKTQSLCAEETKVATPKPIRKGIQKSESGEDFWSHIGTRETLYMTNRKKNVLGSQWEKQDDLSEMPTEESENNFAELKSSLPPPELEKTAPVAPVEKPSEDKVDAKTKPPKLELQKPLIPIAAPSTPTKVISPLKKKQETDAAKALVVSTAKVLESATTAAAVSAPTATVAPTATKTTATSPKISSGHEAKSPEQPNKIPTAGITAKPTIEGNGKGNYEKTISPTTTTTTSPAIATSPTVSAAKTTELAIKLTTATSATKPKITTSKQPPAASKPTITTTTAGAAAIKQAEPKTPKLSEAAKKSSNADPKPAVGESSPTSAAIDKSKVQPAAVKTKAGGKKTEPTTPTNLSAAKKTSPQASPTSTSATINADQFVTVAPPKTAGTTLAATSPTKARNASPKAKPTTVAAAVGVAKTLPSGDNKATGKTATGVATPITPSKLTAAAAAAAADTATTAGAKATNATTTATSATSDAAAHDTSDKGNSNNGLTKFATVSNLAQCLQDVDGDLDDYVPSSADNSDDDDSTDDYSSANGQNLTASMKKKLKQRRKKEKAAAAAPAGFDPHKKVKIDVTNKCYVKEETPRYPLVATPRPLWKREKIPAAANSDESDSDGSGSTEETTEDSDEYTSSSEEDDLHRTAGAAATSGAATNTGSSNSKDNNNSSIIRLSTCSNDSGFEGGTAPSSPKKMLECDVNCHKKCERLTANLCGVNQKLIVEALAYVKRGTRDTRESPSTPPSLNPAYKIEANEEQDETSYTYSQFQKSGRFTAPATIIPRFKNYTVDDFHFLTVLGKGSFGKVLLAELRDTTYYYAVKCLKKDVVLEDDDVDSTLIERKVLALGTKHPYLCHLFCTFQTESHLFFVMEYLNGGDLMFHIQESGRFTEERARFYGAEIISGLKFLHKKGIIYRDLKLDNVLLDYEGHVRIADFGMCKLQIYLDKTADSFCGTPDYMAPEIVKGEKYNQNVDWWSFGVLLYEMLIGQSPFSGCDEDELFWSICNERPWFPVYISAEATSILKGLLEKDYTKRVGSQYSPAGEVAEHIFFQPIDWNLLEKRQLQPPFKPQVKHPLDTQYFDRVFTRERVRLTPIDKEILQSLDQKQFHGFTYTNPHITLDD